MIRVIQLAMVAVTTLLTISPVEAAFTGAVTREVLELTLERSARNGSATLEDDAARALALSRLDRLSQHYGVGALRIVEDSGLELLDAMPAYGDDVLQLTARSSPAGRRALALNAQDLVPLARRVGVDAIELEARAPGQATKVFELFGDDLGKVAATAVRTQDMPRIIKYAELSDSAHTRGLLIDAYRKEGPGLFERIPPRLVLAGGLSSAMVLGVYEATAPSRAKAKVLEENPEIVRDVMNHSTLVWATVGLTMALILLWVTFGSLPWSLKNSSPSALTGCRPSTQESHKCRSRTTPEKRRTTRAALPMPSTRRL
jgi:hypothetical protein